MIDSILVALSGMKGHERGLNVISHNVANINTPGFRGSAPTFADVLNEPGFDGSAAGGALDAGGAQVDLRPGDPMPTGRDLDARIDGPGFFVLQDASGALRYTRAGRFERQQDGSLVALDRPDMKVMTRDPQGRLTPLVLATPPLEPGQPTTQVTFQGTLSSADTDGHVVDPVNVFDAQGMAHTLQLKCTRESASSPSDVKWKLSITEGGLEIGTATLKSLETSVPLSVLLALKDGPAATVAFDFSKVQMQNTGSTSNMGVDSANGAAPTVVAAEQFDERGALRLQLSDGSVVGGPRLALATFTDDDALIPLGDALFAARDGGAIGYREGGDGMRIVSKELERSNVDLTSQFSELILMQRGYQAASQVVSTANDLMQDLLDLRGRR
jgi:flagellar hook protein FlgE